MKLDLTTIENSKSFDKILSEYRVYAPISKPFKGTMSDTDSIRYEEITNFENINFNDKSQFSAKEVILPITKVLYHFSEDAYTEPKVKDDKILLFVRACDIHAIRSLDLIYMNNGPKDKYYTQARKRITFALIGCESSFRNCFCVSMKSNKAENYSIGFKPVKDRVYVEIKDDSFNSFYHDDSKKIDFEMDYVTENDIKVTLPENLDGKEVAKHDMWREYDTRCIACGKCNFVCPTCSCFAMQDIYYLENENIGERRRVWASCHVKGYSDMAGGHSYRVKNGDKMRFKSLHKVHDFKKRFGEHMCIGCGRCDDACPSYISFSNCINKLSNLEKESK